MKNFIKAQYTKHIRNNLEKILRAQALLLGFEKPSLSIWAL